MRMQVLGHTGPGGRAQVHADVHPVAAVGGPQGGYPVTNDQPELGHLVGIEPAQFLDGAVGQHQQMTVRVRIGVEHGAAAGPR